MFCNKKNKTRKTRANRNLSKGPQKLEDRQLMAGDFFGITPGWSMKPEIWVDGDSAQIKGSNYSDQVEVSFLTHGNDDPSDDYVRIEARNGIFVESLFVKRFDDAGNPKINEIVFHGNNGNDRFQNDGH